MPGSVPFDEIRKQPDNATSNRDNSTNETTNADSGYLSELTLTDKLNKKLLCSYLQRINEEDKSAAEGALKDKGNP